MMTLEEARAAIGSEVVFQVEGRPAETGVITSVGPRLVFVRYGRDLNSKATHPDDLTPVVEAQPMPFTAFITGEHADRGTLAFLWEEALSEHNGTPADGPGDHGGPMSAPGVDCFAVGGHMYVDWAGPGQWALRLEPGLNGTTAVRACWCLWCGMAVADLDITEATLTGH